MRYADDATRYRRGARMIEYSLAVLFAIATLAMLISHLGSKTNRSFECAGRAYRGRSCAEGVRLDR